MPKKVYTGEVVSNKMQKTVVVEVRRLSQHPAYKKTVKKVTRLMAHDPGGVCQTGDKVSIVESRPLSKNKKWTVLKVEKKA